MSTVVLVHGAWHGGWCWQRLAPLLRAAGHDVHHPTLTGLGDRAHLRPLRALDHYRAGESARCAAAPESDRTVRTVLRDWLGTMVTGDDGPPGCFVINTATELGTDDPEAARRVQAAFDGTAAALVGCRRRRQASPCGAQ